MACMQQTHRSIHRRNADGLLALEAGYYRRPKHPLEGDRTELPVERKIPQVRQENLVCEGIGDELRHRRYVRSVADNTTQRRELRGDAFPRLIGGDPGPRVASDLPKIHRSSVKYA